MVDAIAYSEANEAVGKVVGEEEDNFKADQGQEGGWGGSRAVVEQEVTLESLEEGDMFLR